MQKSRFLMVLLLTGCLAGAAVAQSSDTILGVAGLGFVEPRGGVTTVAGGAAANQGIVAELMVREGDRISKNDVLAALAGKSLLEAALLQAESRLAVQLAQLARVQAGASRDELEAQQAVVERIRRELANTQEECTRQRQLFERKIISESAYLQQCNKEDLVQGRLTEAEATLKALGTIRPEDIQISVAEVESARTNVNYARVALEDSIIRAPIDGTVLAIHATEGERIGTAGLLDMGDVTSMWVNAEIYESDIHKVRAGQPARIIAQGIDVDLGGTVRSIGLLVARNEILATNPTADVDARVVRVRIELDPDDSARLAALTNLQVSVVLLD